MSVALSQLAMTQEQFFDWAQRQDARYEFDGFQPVAMVGGNVGHNRITLGLHRALYARLKGSGCQPFGPDAGVQTVGNSVRYPDGLITCTQTLDSAYLVQGVCVVFEVVSPTSSHMDRIIKLREYRAVPSILRYVILEGTTIGLTVHARASGEDPWTTSSLGQGETLGLPEVGIAVPVDEFYEGMNFEAAVTRT